MIEIHPMVLYSVLTAVGAAGIRYFVTRQAQQRRDFRRLVMLEIVDAVRQTEAGIRPMPLLLARIDDLDEFLAGVEGESAFAEQVLGHVTAQLGRVAS